MELSSLGMDEETLTRVRGAIARPHGIFLVTGPTGSGKTTTLYAAMGELNRDSINILTIENPIEYMLPGIGQTQVNDKANMTFARGLRAILRQDPDVVMVGEIRDLETAETAVQASLTGHLVMSTVHTNTAVGSVTRLVDMGVEPFLIASSVVGMLAQRLVRVLCPSCKVPSEANAMEQQLLGEAARGATIYRPGGCEECGNSGFKGRHRHLRTRHRGRRPARAHSRSRFGTRAHGLCAPHLSGHRGRRAAQSACRRHFGERGAARQLGGLSAVAVFEYVALDANGRRRKGVVEGDGGRQARQALRDQGLSPLSVTATEGRAANGDARPASNQRRRLRWGRGMSPLELALVTRQLATLIAAGLPVEQALGTIAQQTGQRRVSTLMMNVRRARARRPCAGGGAGGISVGVRLHVSLHRGGRRTIRLPARGA